MIAIHLYEFIAIIVGVLTAMTLTYVIRDRRYKLMHDLFEVEREQNRVLVEKLAECNQAVQELRRQPNLEQHAALLTNLIDSFRDHEDDARQRWDLHEKRAQARADATVVALKAIAARMER